ncbi:hypothetical protein MC885_008987 [Smutsia gigantea]|nr:hypothetical protein MC885_008987 [Smutsia gigantea]
MLLLFFIGLLLILLLQVAAGILGATLKPQSVSILNETLYKNVELLHTTEENGKAFQKALAEFQEEFKCCGLVNGAADWGNNFQEYSKSCECPPMSDMSDSYCTMYDQKKVYKQPCITAIKDLLSKHIILITGLALGLAVIEVQCDLALVTVHSLFVH